MIHGPDGMPIMPEEKRVLADVHLRLVELQTGQLAFQGQIGDATPHFLLILAHLFLGEVVKRNQQLADALAAAQAGNVVPVTAMPNLKLN